MKQNNPQMTDWFDIPAVNPTIDGVYEVATDHWCVSRFSMWKNGMWHAAANSVSCAEKDRAKSILLYENCNAQWRGFVEKQEPV